MSEFLIKYLLRVTHIGSIIAICHKAITDFQMNDISSAHSGMYAILGIAAIVSGFINTFILKPKKMGEKRMLWVGYHHFKLLITIILYTPLIQIFSSPVIAQMRFYWMISIIFAAPFMRFYRQKHSADKRLEL